MFDQDCCGRSKFCGFGQNKMQTTLVKLYRLMLLAGLMMLAGACATKKP
jgi:hypothetical protein